MALNARQERFAQLIALGQMSQTEAAKEAGYSKKAASTLAHKLVSNGQVAARIDSLTKTVSFKHDVTRDKVIAEVAKLALVTPEPAIPTPSEKLKALAQLSQLLGYNEPEKRVHEHTHLNVDASLIEQLRAGYGEMTARQRLHKACVLEGGLPVGGTREEATPAERESMPPTPQEGQNIDTISALLRSPEHGIPPTT